ncbi:PepSY domain-containing protein [Gemella cuniculi]|uniref:PepSY domain-containing protein n=1 Tax=Gemella cuniculi TaxID=150240 RepID=UPI0003F4F77C|nr:PepSY domain-containing protein [Gemella cuniculi]
MTNKIDDNKIETLDGNYVENVNNSENMKYANNQEIKKQKRNFLKPFVIGALAIVVTSGVGVYAYDKYEKSQRAKIQDAYSKVKMNVGTQNNSENKDENNSQTEDVKANQETTTNVKGADNVENQSQNIKSQAEIRQIVAQAISTPESNIRFDKLRTEYEDDYAYKNNGRALLIYDVEVRANGLEYDIEIDAITGKVLKVEIDN